MAQSQGDSNREALFCKEVGGFIGLGKLSCHSNVCRVPKANMLFFMKSYLSGFWVFSVGYNAIQSSLISSGHFVFLA